MLKTTQTLKLVSICFFVGCTIPADEVPIEIEPTCQVDRVEDPRTPGRFVPQGLKIYAHGHLSKLGGTGKPRSVYGYYDGDFVTLWIRPVNDKGWARLRVVQEKKLPQVMIDAGDVHQIANINLVDALTDTTQYTWQWAHAESPSGSPAFNADGTLVPFLIVWVEMQIDGRAHLSRPDYVATQNIADELKQRRKNFEGTK